MVLRWSFCAIHLFKVIYPRLSDQPRKKTIMVLIEIEQKNQTKNYRFTEIFETRSLPVATGTNRYNQENIVI